MQNLETEIEIVRIAEEAVAAGALEGMVVVRDLVVAEVVADVLEIRKGLRKDPPINLV
jgi:hypothetical protein